jgi:hypothetical protein
VAALGAQLEKSRTGFQADKASENIELCVSPCEKKAGRKKEDPRQDFS